MCTVTILVTILRNWKVIIHSPCKMLKTVDLSLRGRGECERLHFWGGNLSSRERAIKCYDSKKKDAISLGLPLKYQQRFQEEQNLRTVQINHGMILPK